MGLWRRCGGKVAGGVVNEAHGRWPGPSSEGEREHKLQWDSCSTCPAGLSIYQAHGLWLAGTVLAFGQAGQQQPLSPRELGPTNIRR